MEWDGPLTRPTYGRMIYLQIGPATPRRRHRSLWSI